MITQQLFIFQSSTDYRDRKKTQDLVFWGISDEGVIRVVFTAEKSVFFIDKGTSIGDVKGHRKPLKLKSFQGREVDGLYFDTYLEAVRARGELEKLGVRTYENDVRTDERFLMERFINGSVEVNGQVAFVEGVKTYVNPEITSAEYRPRFSMLSLDIETGIGGELYSIAYHYKSDNDEKKLVHMIGDCENQENVYFYNDEKILLLNFVQVIRDWDPDLLIGWHVVGFDLDFLDKKASQHGVDLAIGRTGKCLSLTERNGKTFARIEGRVIVDGPTVLKGAFFRFENFKLETVAQEILGVGKDISSDDNKVSEIERRFREDKLSLARYNLLDCELVTQIYEKTKIIDLTVERVHISGMLFDRVGFSNAAFDHCLLPQIHRKGYVAPNVFDMNREGGSSGGHVFEPEVGLHEDVILLDFKSLYPSIIRTFHIDPYSLMIASMGDIEPHQIVNTPAGVNFSRFEYILPNVMKKLLSLREKAKNTNNTHLSQAIKILMNSFYGVMGSSSCRFYHADLARSITETGHWLLKEGKSFLEGELGYRVVYGDTDSLFVVLKSNDIGRPFERAKELADLMNEYLKEKIEGLYQVDSHVVIEFEKYFRKIFFSEARSGKGGAKKRYAGLLENTCGEKELSFSGLEIVRQDWTTLAKKFQYQLYEKLFDGDNDLEDWIRDFVERVKDKEFDKDMIYKKRITKGLEEYTKNVPPHIKAAKMIDRTGQVYRLKEVRYVITRQGPTPVQIRNHLEDIDYQHYIDKQIKPIADSVLFYFELCFDDIVQGDQLTLF